MLLELLECGFGFADADSELVASAAIIDDASGDNEDCGLVCNVCSERINFEEVTGFLSPE
jgi:hypothetical protein